MRFQHIKNTIIIHFTFRFVKVYIQEKDIFEGIFGKISEKEPFYSFFLFFRRKFPDMLELFTIV